MNSMGLPGRELLEKKYGRLVNNVFSEGAAKVIRQALVELAGDRAVRDLCPGIEADAESLASAMQGGGASERECALVDLYLRLHSAGSAYTPVEERNLLSRRGISCQPGGLLPLILAEPFIGPDTTVADLGAGNGLQGLLLQRLAPHRKTLQIELSSEMIRTGRIFQRALGIGDDKLRWVNSDIADADFGSAGFVYIYRPARPVGEGNDLYRTIAERLSGVKGPLVVLSVADCLGRFLDDRFSEYYSNSELAFMVRA